MDRKISVPRPMLAYFVIFLGALWSLGSLYWLFITAFKPLREVHSTWSPTPGMTYGVAVGE